MSTIAIDNFKPSAGGTSFGIEGIAKARFEYDQTTPTVTYDLNVSSITDNSTGDFTVSYTNSFSNTTYTPHGVVLMLETSNKHAVGVGPNNNSLSDERATGSCPFNTIVAADSGANAFASDRNISMGVLYGDLA